MTVTRSTLLKIFVSALAVRWTYALLLYATMGKAGLMGADSVGFYALVQDFAARLVTGQAAFWEWVSPHHQLMPLYTWLLTFSILIGGDFGPLVYVLLQSAFDAGTCVVIYSLAGTLSPRFALPAAVASIVNPTQIAMSGLIYPDTPFVFFVALFLYGSVRWLGHPTWQSAAIIGVGLGGAALFRILVVPWTPALLVILIILIWLIDRFRARYFGQLIMAGAILCCAIAPILVRNVLHYNAFALTAQGGTHLAIWVVPLVKEAADGTPWAVTAEEMQKKTSERFGPAPSNPFASSRQQTELGREVLWGLGLPAIVKAWINGSVINIASPAVTLVPPVAQLPRTGFYDTRGETFPAKVFNFLFRSDNTLYAKLLLAGLAGVGLMRLLQLFGLWIAFRESEQKLALLLLLSWAGYILVISGPIASPKYRLPIEPVFMVLTGAGIAGLRRKRPRDAAPVSRP